MPRQPTLNEAARSAIAWEMRLRSGEVGADERAGFEAWRQASRANDEAWRALQARLQPLRALAARHPVAARQALVHADASRRRVLVNGLAGTAGMLVLGIGGLRIAHELGYDATFRTGIGERREVALAAGIRGLLDAGTAVYATDEAASWRVDSGRLLVDASSAAAPFSVASPHGRLQAAGARFSLGVLDASSALVMERGQGVLQLRDGGAHPVAAGEVLGFTARALRRVEASVAAALAWTSDLLVASDESVADVVSVLRRYRRGLIRVSDDAARRRVSGVFSLKDPDQALRQLAESLSLRVDRYSDYVVILRER